MACFEWERLLRRFRELVHAYHDSVNEMPEIDGPQFDEAWANAEELRVLCLSARLRFEAHQLDHGCCGRKPAATERLRLEKDESKTA